LRLRFCTRKRAIRSTRIGIDKAWTREALGYWVDEMCFKEMREVGLVCLGFVPGGVTSG
jgi:hypothetical protein